VISSTSNNYQASVSFQKLKVIKESIDGNLTTAQYLRVYDAYLSNAIEPIIVNCRAFDIFLGQLTSWQVRQPRRKVTMGDRKDLPRLVTRFLISQGREARLAAYRELNLDRGILVSFTSTFLDSFKDYMQALDLTLKSSTGVPASMEECLRIKALIESNFKTKEPLFGILNEAEHWLNIALNFKAKIVEKYVRLTISAAQRDYIEVFDCSVKLDDILQTYLAYTSRAIDRCDFHQGALTSHIQTHFLAARNAVTKQRQLHLKLVEIQKLDQESFDNHLEDSRSYLTERENQETAQRISRLARIVDPRGAARAFLGIPESLSTQELKKLHSLKKI
jgi:hypothetical protein